MPRPLLSRGAAMTRRVLLVLFALTLLAPGASSSAATGRAAADPGAGPATAQAALNCGRKSTACRGPRGPRGLTGRTGPAGPAEYAAVWNTTSAQTVPVEGDIPFDTNGVSFGDHAAAPRRRHPAEHERLTHHHAARVAHRRSSRADRTPRGFRPVPSRFPATTSDHPALPAGSDQSLVVLRDRRRTRPALERGRGRSGRGRSGQPSAAGRVVPGPGPQASEPLCVGRGD